MSALPDPLASWQSASGKTFARFPNERKLPQYFQLGTDLDAVLTEDAIKIAPRILREHAADESVVRAILMGDSGQNIEQGVASVWPSQNYFLTPEVSFAAPTDSSEAPEIQWLRENSLLLKRYQGEWLLILGNALISHNVDFGMIRSIIAELRVTSPFVYYVPTDEESNFVLI